MIPRINLFLQILGIHNREGDDIMLKINPLSTLYIGIDVSSKSNYVCALYFYKNKYINSSFANNQPGAKKLAQKILECLKEIEYEAVANGLHPPVPVLLQMEH